ncbi:MAG: AMP-dependent synthetase [Actinomycetia bacterium]|nr:AMP-dependent synthetase [Actinomycetes bacterium]
MTEQVMADRPKSVPAMFFARVAESGPREAFRFPAGDRWESITWDEAAQRVHEIAAGLLARGLAPEDRVAIIAATSVDWILADLGVLCAGAATTAVYPTTGPEDAAYIIGDSGSRFVFADADQLDKLTAVRGDLPAVEGLIAFPGETPATTGGDWISTLDGLRAEGAKQLAADPGIVERASDAVGPGSLATLIYTSGTTGRPKGVQLVHDCWTFEGTAQVHTGLIRPDDVQFLWLPLSHSFGRTLLTGQLAAGFPMAVDGRIDKIVDNLPVIRPTIMAAAPRIFEKVYNRIVSTTRAEGGLKYKIFSWAVSVGRAKSRAEQAGRDPGIAVSLQYAIADKLVFAKVRERFGGRLRGCVSGSAPLAPEIAEFFDAAGIPIFEGYGLTETSAGATVNTPDANRIGTVGPPLPGAEIKIAADGEVLVRGPLVMRGYHNLPEQTAEVLDPDGWFRTGDIGELDDHGHLRITDRKKDLIKTSGGKYVAPSAVEGQFKASCPYIGQVLVIGHARNYCTALIALDAEALGVWAAGAGLGDLGYGELVAHPQVRELISPYVDEVNSKLNRWETVKRFELLPADMTVANGQLTPSLKVKRRVVEDEYRDLIRAMYAGALEEV